MLAPPPRYAECGLGGVTPADLDSIVVITGFEGGLRRGRWAIFEGAVPQVKARAVARADDLVALDRALAERAAAVRSAVVDREDLLAAAQEEHRRVVDYDPRRVLLTQQ